MKALRFREFGGFDKLKVEDVPDPQPGPNDVVVQIRAASLNPSDAKNILGQMEGTTLPRTPGRDFAGVVARGPAPLIGAEVWGTGGELGFTRDGGYAERLLLPASAVRAKPKNLSFDEAAAAGTNYATAWLGLIEAAKLRAGETVLVTGVAGGVGSAVTQIAKWKGAHTIGVNRTPISVQRQQEAAIDCFFLSIQEENYKHMLDGIRATTNGNGVDIAYDCVGGPLFEPCLRSLAQLGRQVNITSAGERRVSFDLLDFYHRRLSLFGVDSRAYDATACAAILEQLRPGFESGALQPAPVVKRYTLDEAALAFAAVKNGSAHGKIVFSFPASAATAA